MGYEINAIDELEFLKEVAVATGVVLDPVYRCSIVPLHISFHFCQTILSQVRYHMGNGWSCAN